MLKILHLKAPPDAVNIMRLRAPSGNPWMHWNQEKQLNISPLAWRTQGRKFILEIN